MSHLYDLVLAPVGLKATQYIILRAIDQVGEVAHCDLARLFTASEENFSRRLASARASGWVQMKVGQRYRRVYGLTDEGRRIVEQATPYWERAQERMRREMGEEQFALLAEFAERVTQCAIRAEMAPHRNGRPRSAA